MLSYFHVVSLQRRVRIGKIREKTACLSKYETWYLSTLFFSENFIIVAVYQPQL